MQGFDTHMHSNASDGACSPAEVVRLAKERGLLGMALTDHDTMAGVAEAMAEGERLDFTVIPGVELSAEYQGHEVHILGYWLDAEALEADGYLAELRAARSRRIFDLADRLTLLGMPVDAEAILSKAGNSPGRPHVAAAMIEAGYVVSVREAFRLWLGNGKPAYVPRRKMDPLTAVKMVKNAGGVAALAHPGCGVPDSLLPALLVAGIGGMEVFHPEHDRGTEGRYVRIARRCQLALLGGSDFHSPEFRRPGSRVTTLEQLEQLAAKRGAMYIFDPSA